MTVFKFIGAKAVTVSRRYLIWLDLIASWKLFWKGDFLIVETPKTTQTIEHWQNGTQSFSKDVSKHPQGVHFPWVFPLGRPSRLPPLRAALPLKPEFYVTR